MRRRWHRGLIDEMRTDNALRRVELERWRAQFEDYRTEWRTQVEAERAEQKRRFDAIDAAMENDKRVTREMIIELRHQTSVIRDMRHRIQANTEGLLRVLDEFRRNDGPSAAGA